MHTTVIVQQLWGDPDPILLNEPHGLFPALRGRMGHDDDWRGGREHLVGELVVGREGRNDRKGYVALLESLSWAPEPGGRRRGVPLQ